MLYRTLPNGPTIQLERIPLHGSWGVVRGAEDNRQRDVVGTGVGVGGDCVVCTVEGGMIYIAAMYNYTGYLSR